MKDVDLSSCLTLWFNVSKSQYSPMVVVAGPLKILIKLTLHFNASTNQYLPVAVVVTKLENFNQVEASDMSEIDFDAFNRTRSKIQS